LASHKDSSITFPMTHKTQKHTLTKVRATFLDFFADKGHKKVASSSLVPHNDPTLLFTNAGMVPFKNYFTRVETPPYNRATSSQKCVRAGGKHNDLENVGYTARHHTFFEMLGNFSFGDYFKEDAIAFAWELVTKEYGLPADKLLVTVHSSDEEAAGIWRKVAGLSDDKIIRIPTDDNFWSMGDTGPCGPCSEIFFDHGDKVAGGPPGSPDEDGDRFIEIWNLVFMQFEQLADGTRVELPKPSIDTGMGLERISAILQGKHNNYETDLMQALVDVAARITETKSEGEALFSHRVMADHIRSTSFLLADGVMPSNEGRGYVLRRILRRAMRHAHILGGMSGNSGSANNANEPVFYKMLPTLVKEMGEAYPELGRAESMIAETLQREEENFKRTLDKGLKLLEEEASALAEAGTLSGDVAFKLYDTYGFPLDLTADILKGQGKTVDQKAFDAAMAEQKARARAAWKGSGEEENEQIWFDIYEAVGPTEFLGYAQEEAQAKVLTLVKDGAEVDQLAAGETGWVITNQTPFYGESGGQTGDSGLMLDEKNVHKVLDAKKKFGDLTLHQIEAAGPLTKGADVTLQVDHGRRQSIREHHSATHLLHAALRETLGDHVAQKGSQQDDGRTRFDISHPKAIEADELAAIEAKINAEIRANTPVTTRVMETEAAIEAGARAMFGEKYGDEVRVVSMGAPDPQNNGNPYSVELCGGTHVTRTGDIGLFKILSESAISSGVRRVEAVAGGAALAYFAAQEAALKEVSAALKVPPAEIPSRIDTLLAERKSMEAEVSKLRKQLATGSAAAEVKDVNGIKYQALLLDGIPPKELRPMVDELKGKLGSGVVTLVTTNEGKVSLAVGVTGDLTDRINAVDLVRKGAEALGGKGGGGKPDFAQAGGTDAANANQAFDDIAGCL